MSAVNVLILNICYSWFGTWGRGVHLDCLGILEFVHEHRALKNLESRNRNPSLVDVTRGKITSHFPIFP